MCPTTCKERAIVAAESAAGHEALGIYVGGHPVLVTRRLYEGMIPALQQRPSALSWLYPRYKLQIKQFCARLPTETPA